MSRWHFRRSWLLLAATMPRRREGTRRTGHVRTRGRAARGVERIVGATVAELSRVGYEAMRVEDVAARSGVNKTTIYRRWPTKAEMVASALVEGTKLRPAIDTGSLREDLRISLLGAFKLKPSEQGVLRIMQMERSIADVDALARRMRDELRNARIAIVRRGIARGELPTARGDTPAAQAPGNRRPGTARRNHACRAGIRGDRQRARTLDVADARAGRYARGDHGRLHPVGAGSAPT